MYVLILFFHVGIMGSGNSNSVTTQEFTSLETCKVAIKEVSKVVKGTVKEVHAICLPK